MVLLVPPVWIVRLLTLFCADMYPVRNYSFLSRPISVCCCDTLLILSGTGLQGQAVFKNKVTFRPHSTDSQTHRKMTLSIADRFSKAQKIRVLPAVGMNPESQRNERIKVRGRA